MQETTCRRKRRRATRCSFRPSVHQFSFGKFRVRYRERDVVDIAKESKNVEQHIAEARKSIWQHGNTAADEIKHTIFDTHAKDRTYHSLCTTPNIYRRMRRLPIIQQITSAGCRLISFFEIPKLLYHR